MSKFLVFLLLFAVAKINGQHSLLKLPYPTNSEFLDEICPVLSFDEKKLFFTRTADPLCEKSLMIDSVDVYHSLNPVEYHETLQYVYKQLASATISDPLSSDYNQDIWFTELINGQAEGIFHPGFPINDVLPNSICAQLKNNNQYLVLNQFALYGGMELGFSHTTERNGQFSFPKPIRIDSFFAKSTKVNITSAPDGNYLIIAMKNMPIDTTMDLFISTKIGEDHYSKPQKLSSQINTEYEETTPHLSTGGKFLFYSSNKPSGLGGMDIYYSERLDNAYKSWSVPRRLDPPVNSVYNDSYPFLMSDDDHLYFTSDRDGSSDIFEAKLKRSPILKPLIVHINIVSASTGQLVPGEVYWLETYPDLTQNIENKGYFRSKNGKFDLKIHTNRSLKLYAINRQMTSDTIIIDPQLLIDADSTDLTINLVLKSDTSRSFVFSTNQPEPKIIVEAYKSLPVDTIENMLHNIYFEQSRSIVLPKSYLAIDKLAEIMLRFPRLYVSINGHTDNVGDTDALIRLSQERADAIKNVLISKNILPMRVNAVGFGPNKHVAPNDSEINKSKNRRVEIKVLSM